MRVCLLGWIGNCLKRMCSPAVTRRKLRTLSSHFLSLFLFLWSLLCRSGANLPECPDTRVIRLIAIKLIRLLQRRGTNLCLKSTIQSFHDVVCRLLTRPKSPKVSQIMANICILPVSLPFLLPLKYLLNCSTESTGNPQQVKVKIEGPSTNSNSNSNFQILFSLSFAQ